MLLFTKAMLSDIRKRPGILIELLIALVVISLIAYALVKRLLA
jgi:hypothetical protein